MTPRSNGLLNSSIELLAKAIWIASSAGRRKYPRPDVITNALACPRNQVDEKPQQSQWIAGVFFWRTYPAKITASALRPAAASQPSIGTRADGDAAPVLMGAEPEPI
jgi:hypothetical protein